MAGPITHVVLSLKVFDKFFGGKDVQKFIVGTSFPDIRYLGVIERDKSHFENITLHEILTLDSFYAGLKFHSLVDKVREAYMVKNDYYSLFPQSKMITQAQKMLEDRLIYDKISDWKAIIKYFEGVDEEEIKLTKSVDHIKKWHKFLADYFSAKPNDENNIEFTVDLGFPKEQAEEMNRVLRSCQLEKAKQVITTFYDTFEQLVQAV